MVAFKDLFENNIDIGLHEISYKGMGDAAEGVKLLIRDAYEAELKTPEKLRLIGSREVVFEPRNVFKLKVSFFVEWRVKEEYVESVNWEDYDIEKEVQSAPELFMINEWDRLSLLISQITASFNMSPLVTLPMPTVEDEDEAQEG